MLKNRDDSKQRKIDGLLKLIQQKSNEIETLKADICNLQSEKASNQQPRPSLIEQINSSSDVNEKKLSKIK